jgi:hypothetical protein
MELAEGLGDGEKRVKQHLLGTPYVDGIDRQA